MFTYSLYCMKQGANLAQLLAQFLNQHEISVESPVESFLRSEVIAWLDSNFEVIMENPYHRRDFAKWLMTELDETDRRQLRVIMDFGLEGTTLTSAGNPWRFLNYGLYEEKISLDPELAANLYGSFLVDLKGVPEQPIHAYDNVRLVGDKCDHVSLHDNARYKDMRPFFVNAWYIQNPNSHELQWEDYRLTGKTDSLLCEAHWCLESDSGDMDVLQDVGRSLPSYRYDECLAEDDQCSVVYNPVCESYTVYAKVDPDKIFYLWEKDNVFFVDLRPDFQELIKEHVQADFWVNPNGEWPVPGHSDRIATYDKDNDLIVVREKGDSTAVIQQIKYDYDCSLVDNLRMAAKALDEERSMGYQRGRSY